MHRVTFGGRAREGVEDVNQRLGDPIVGPPSLERDPDEPGQRVDVVLGEPARVCGEPVEDQERPGEPGDRGPNRRLEPRRGDDRSRADRVVKAGETIL